MRLLRFDSSGKLIIRKHETAKLPPYAILSHTWGFDDQEVTFRDIKNGTGKNKSGFAKIKFCGEQALKDDLKDFWVDSCCINKPNHSELSEAIISMFRWYKRAAKCYVYLSDVSATKRSSDGQLVDWEDAFRKSNWFTRGWTLQELLAPACVEFWSRDGHLLGTRAQLAELISSITDIPLRALTGTSLSEFSSLEKLRWAASRNTRRVEDKAYSLLGIFNIFLQPLYGEEENAFARLEQEIAKHHGPIQSTQISRSSPSASSLPIGRRELLDSLSFDEMDARHSDIDNAESTTCEWLKNHPDYLAWIEQNGILWIAGKPGAGKSTLMKFALATSKKTKRNKAVVLSFFFHARGEDIEKSTVGAYRSLLHQLLTTLPDLQSVLDDFKPKRPLIWSVDDLQKLLTAATNNLGSRRLKLFIDALDECNESHVREMVKFLEHLIKSSSEQSRLSICFASRHYPTIKVHNARRLVLEDQDGHSEDLKEYIRRHFQPEEGTAVDDIRTEIQKRANGVFMWVVLVVKILNEEFCDGRIFAVQERLREIPSKLSDLFKNLLKRDCKNMDDLLLCLQWILFAKRPLRREEFYFGMEAGLPDSLAHVAGWKPKPWNKTKVTVEYMERFVLSSSKGLAELTRSKRKPTVQFIHESVRDFLLKDGGLKELWPQSGDDLVAASHERLKRCCLNYLTSDLADTKFSGARNSSARIRGSTAAASEMYPFLQYASAQILYHANEAAAQIDQTRLLQDFPTAQWIRIHNLCETRKIRHHSTETSLLYILSEHNCHRLMITHGLEDIGCESPGARFEYPIVAAFTHGSLDAIRAILGHEADYLLDDIAKHPDFGRISRCLFHGDVLKWAVDIKCWGLVKSILAHCVETNRTFGLEPENKQQFLHEVNILIALEKRDTRALKAYVEKHLIANVPIALAYGVTLAELAIREGDVAIVKWLVDTGAYMNGDGENNDLPKWLYLAACLGHEELVQLFLDGGASPNLPYQNFSRDCFALCGAAANGYDGIVLRLLAHGALISTVPSNLLNKALVRAAEAGLLSTVKLLIDHGADVNDGDGNALHTACENGHVDIVKLLFTVGARVGNGRSTLTSMALSNHTHIMQMLLEHGADVNAQSDNDYFANALQTAALAGRLDAVRLLLDAGARVNMQGGYYSNALQAAACSGDKDIVRLLIEAGAKVNAQGGYYGNVLQAAASHRSVDIVRLLIKAGAEGNAQGGHYGNALQAAAIHGSVDIVRLLIETGAEVNAQGGCYGNALQAAAVFGDLGTIRLLLDAEADVNAQGGAYGNALAAARMENNSRVEQILLEHGAVPT